MGACEQPGASLARRLAGELLQAWDSGDAAKVHAQLEHSIGMPIEACDAREEERRQVLKAVAGRMWKCPDLFEFRPQSPVLEVCGRMLGHLASPD
jgi:hypothetical protein